MNYGITFDCKECGAELVTVIKIKNGIEASSKAICLECGEPHHILLEISHPKSSSQTYRKESWLKDQYETNGRSMASIAKECAVSPMTIHKWLKTHNIKTRPTGQRKK